MQTHVGCSHSQVEFSMHLGTSKANIPPHVRSYRPHPKSPTHPIRWDHRRMCP